MNSPPETRMSARRLSVVIAIACASLSTARAVLAQPRVLEETPSIAPLPGETNVTATLVASYPLNEKPSAPTRGAAANAIYSNIDHPLNIAFQNGGASGTGAAAITRLIADDLNRAAGPGTVSSFSVALANASTGSITARPRVRFYQNQVPGNAPGNVIVGYTLNPLTLGPNSISIFNIDVPAFTATSTVWAGITFDAGGSGSPLATLSQLNQLGVGLYEPPTLGTSGPNLFLTTNAGSFLSNNPSGSLMFFESIGWELRSPLGACCFSAGPCQLLEETPCLTQGGAFLGVGSGCASCATVHDFNTPPPPNSRYLLDQVTSCDLQAPSLLAFLSQQFALPPASAALNNSAYLDEFTVPYKMVVTRADALITLDASAEYPSQNGYVFSLFPSVSSAAGDVSLQTSVVYTQGYTVPLVRGGGEYELSININNNPWNLSGLKVRVDPTIATSRDSGDRGASTQGLVLNPGTYHMAIMFRAPSGWGMGYVSNSTHQDPRYTPNNGVQVNPGGGQFPGLQRNTNAPAAYRILARNCMGDLNSDGSVTTPDLAIFLGLFGGTPGTTSPADLNLDGSVDTGDLALFLGAFGQACR